MLYVTIIISKSSEIFVINKNINTKTTNKFYTYITPYCKSSLGLIFGLENYIQTDKYYFFQINGKGNLTLLKRINGNLENQIIKGNKFIENYNKNNTYKMGISFNPINGNIIASINDDLIYSTNDKTLKGNLVGFISLGKNTVFKQILSEEL